MFIKPSHPPATFFIYFINIIYLADSNILSSLSISEIKHFDINANIVNTSMGCSIHVINFQSGNINSNIIQQPITILNYFSFLDIHLLYPVELSLNKNNKSYEWISQTNMTEFAKSNNIELYNRSVSFTVERSEYFANSFLVKSTALLAKTPTAKLTYILVLPT